MADPARTCRTFLIAEACIGAVLLGFVACGCRFAQRERKGESALHDRADVNVNQDQARLRMRSLVDPMCGKLEEAADRIIAGTTDRAVKRAALLWKIEGVPALREAVFQPDPSMALMDTWVLCNQMADYFETGPGKAALGDSSGEAVKSCRNMEEEITRVAASATISGDVSRSRAFAAKWAADHPIRHSIDDRESALSRVLEREVADSFSTGEAVAEVITTLDDLNRRIEVYSDQLFRQARWEAQLFKADLMAELPLEQVMPLAERAVKSAESAARTLERLAPAIERAVGVAETAPRLIADEREAAVKAVHGELLKTIEFAQQERVAAFEELSRQRIAALKELHESITTERMALTPEIAKISLEIVDHAFWRAAQLSSALLAVVAIGLAVVLVFLKRSPTRAS
jgi:hypothetical protein